MHWSDMNFAPAARTLRQFAALWILFFAGLGFWNGFRHDRWLLGFLLLGVALVVGSLGMARPGWIRPVFVGWMVLAFPSGWLISRLLLAGFFYGILTPLGLVFRLGGRDPLGRRFQGDAVGTYWSAKPPAREVQAYFRQF
jgi:hypothetical protein